MPEKSKRSPTRSRQSNLVRFVKKHPTMSWFDMGLLLDSISDKRPPDSCLPKTFASFMKSLSRGVAFTTCEYGVDGVSVEIGKYGRSIEQLVKKHSKKSANIHLISGEHKKGFECNIKPEWKLKLIENAGGFSDWNGYSDYFHTELARGSKEYNELAEKIWTQTKQVALDIGKYIEENDIQLLFVVNSSSNPGNVSLAFALVLVSEIMQIPVYNSSHDFYWEQGKSKWNRKEGEKPGIRDHFFTNSGIGEVFSLIEMLMPWNSPLWFQSTINKTQSNTLAHDQGFSPNSLAEIGTAVDLKEFKPRTEIDRYETLRRLKQILMHGSDEIDVLSVNKYIEKLKSSSSSDLKTVPKVLGADNHVDFHMNFGNLLFLQPTRVIKRKCIERNFVFLKKLLAHTSFREFFEAHSQLSITLMVTGPVASGQDKYFEFVVGKFKAMLDDLDESTKSRVFLTFCFGNDRYTDENKKRVIENKIYELFSIASLITLPSDQEGRGLPIVEAAASGVPTLCRRYSPEEVFDEVIGTNLGSKQRLRVMTFEGEEFTSSLLEQVTKSIIEPGDCLDDRAHNRAVIKKRYSYRFLSTQLEEHLHKLYNSAKTRDANFATIDKCFTKFDKVTLYGNDFKSIALCENRKYLPGISQIEYMSYLKSLIDPSYFRIEQRELKGRIIAYAGKLVRAYRKTAKLPDSKVEKYFEILESMFRYTKGKHKLAIDHSLCYRHRNRVKFPYRSYTEPELLGIVGLAFRTIVGTKYKTAIPTQTSGIFHDRETLLRFLVNNRPIGIDDSETFFDLLDSNKPIAWFTGVNITLEARLLALAVIKNRLGKSIIDDVGSNELSGERPKDVAALTLFVRDNPLTRGITYESVTKWLKTNATQSIRMLYESGLLNVVKTTQKTPGAHLGQIGKKGKQELNAIKDAGGFAVSFNDHNMYALDLLDLPSVRIGVAKDKLTPHYLNIKHNEAFVQYVPAGVRTSLAYPTPIQTPKEFSELLKGTDYKSWIKRDGKDAVEKILRDDANEKGTPLKTIMDTHFLHSGDTSKSSSKASASIIPSKITGLHHDGAPFSGAKVFVDIKQLKADKVPVQFVTESSTEKGETVMDLANSHEKETGNSVSVAWNGGYILNPELVGKLGLPEQYIGTPLGLLVADGQILSPPLFNKPALAFMKDGSLDIRRANIYDGMTIKAKGGDSLTFGKKAINNPKAKEPSIFDLFFKEDALPKKDRILFRIAGHHIIEVIDNDEKTAEILPVGLVVSIPKSQQPKGWRDGAELEFTMNGWEDVENAVEAGPMLVSNGKNCINMEKGGWKTANSIATQAARIDYTDMRGPKIGTGIDKDGNLIVVCINGRIRESVGATHEDLAKIFEKLKVKVAMGFDPGGSSTLVVDGEQMNISPYNKDYETNPYTLPPEPRFIGNAVLGIFDGK